MPVSATRVGVAQEVKQLDLEMRAVIAVTSLLRSTIASNLNALPCVENKAGIVEGSNHRQIDHDSVGEITGPPKPQRQTFWSI
jgi:hypothetical protein